MTAASSTVDTEASGGTGEMHGTSRIDIHEGKLEEFTRLATHCVRTFRTKDPGTLEYNLFLAANGRECFVHERYRDSAAGLAHMANIASLAQQLSQVCTRVGEVCGTPSPELRKALEDAGVKIYAPLESL